MIANLQTPRNRPVRKQPLPCPVQQNLAENDVRIFWKSCKVNIASSDQREDDSQPSNAPQQARQEPAPALSNGTESRRKRCQSFLEMLQSNENIASSDQREDDSQPSNAPQQPRHAYVIFLSSSVVSPTQVQVLTMKPNVSKEMMERNARSWLLRACLMPGFLI